MKLDENFSLKRYGLEVRLVNEQDAEFIVKLRTHPKLSRYIHRTENDIEKQKTWIRAYKEREKAGEEYYFIFHKNLTPLGLIRLYNIQEETFTTGSWVFDPDAPYEASIFGVLIANSIGFEMLGKKVSVSPDGVNENNKSVVKFHKMIGREFTGKIFDKEIGEYYYTTQLTKENFLKNRAKLERLLIQE